MKQWLLDNKRTLGMGVAILALYVSSKVPALNDLHDYILAFLTASGILGTTFLQPLKGKKADE